MERAKKHSPLDAAPDVANRFVEKKHHNLMIGACIDDKDCWEMRFAPVMDRMVQEAIMIDDTCAKEIPNFRLTIPPDTTV